MTSLVQESSLPVTERTNDFTTSLDVSSSLGMIRQLRQCDAQVFTGYEDFPCLTDASMKQKIQASIACVETILHANLHPTTTTTTTTLSEGRVVLSGSGTSGRLGMLISRDLNRVVRSVMGSAHPLPFGYTISGDDAAILLSDELPEDDPIRAVRDLHRATVQSKQVCLIGITCGLSAPYVAGQVDHVLDQAEQNDDGDTSNTTAGTTTTQYSTIMIGFNPDHLARDNPIELWKDRATAQTAQTAKTAKTAKKSVSVKDVVLRLHAKEKETASPGSGVPSTPSFILLNPIVGPEPICASSRMKGGTCTKILLDVVLGIATARVYGTSFQQYHHKIHKIRTVDAAIDAVLQSFDAARRATYETVQVTSQLSSLIHSVGTSYKAQNGHLYYLGASTAGILGIIDASEMPDTYGAPFEQTRAFLQGGWTAMDNVQGDLSSRGALYQISLTHFQQHVLPTLTAVDTVIVIEEEGRGEEEVGEQVLYGIGLQCGKGYGATVGRIGFDRKKEKKKEKKEEKKEMTLVSEFMQLCGTNYISYPRSPHALIPNHYHGYDTLTLKLALNIVTTCGQIHAGMVYENHMINTGPTNAKIYDRCVRLIARFSHCNYPKEAHVALLRSIWNVDVVTEDMLGMAQVSGGVVWCSRT